MPTFTALTGDYNVNASLNYWLKNNLNVSLPAWKTGGFGINYDYPDVPLFDEGAGDYAPKFSVSHLGTTEDPTHTQGHRLDPGTMGQKQYGIMEISAWVNVKSGATTLNANWRRDLTQMRDMLKSLFSANRTIQIVDVYSSTSNPANAGYLIRIDSVERVDTPPIEPNPNVRRERVLIHYCWWARQVAPIDPATLRNRKLHLKSTVGTYQNTILTTPAAANNDPIGGWQDQSGSGNHATQATAGARPLLKTSVQNGHPTLRFDGINDTLGMVGVDPSTSFTLFIVASKSSVGNGGLISSAAGDPGLAVVSNTGGNSFAWEDTDTVKHTLSATATGINVMAVSRTDGSYERGYFNAGTTVFDDAAATSPAGLPFNALGSGSTVAGADIGEVIMFVPALSSQEIAGVMLFLTSFWGT